MIGFVDFGMVGSVDEPTGHGLVTVLTALVAADPEQLADALVGARCRDDRRRPGRPRGGPGPICSSGTATSRSRTSSLTAVVADLMEVVRRRDLRLPSRIALLLKTVVMCEGVAARLDPAFRLIPLLIPYAAHLTASALPAE